MTVVAVANPVKSGEPPEALNDRVPGYGILRFHRATREITVECWPRWVDPRSRDARQYEGWPITVTGDPTTVVGLPMGRLTPLLEHLGIVKNDE